MEDGKVRKESLVGLTREGATVVADNGTRDLQRSRVINLGINMQKKIGMKMRRKGRRYNDGDFDITVLLEELAHGVNGALGIQRILSTKP